MKERQILFTGEMVRAILEGRKTQTRRVIKIKFSDDAIPQLILDTIRCPYGQIGDRLWVREACIYTPPCWADSESDYNIRDDRGGGRIITYLATARPGEVDNAKQYHLHPHPSIHMPRWASRISLEITGIRVERVKAISKADCVAEGLAPTMRNDSEQNIRVRYQELWNSINEKRGYGWDANPMVWVVEFKVVK